MTTKHETVTLPAEVAAAIEIIKNSGQSLITTADKYLRDDLVVSGTDVGVAINFENLMTALINGYQIEKSPEEKLREYYGGLISHTTLSVNQTCLREREADGILKALSILGITIEGINA